MSSPEERTQNAQGASAPQQQPQPAEAAPKQDAPGQAPQPENLAPAPEAQAPESQPATPEPSRPAPPRTAAPERQAQEWDTELEEFDSLIGSYLDGIAQYEVDSIISAPVVEVHSDHVLVDMGDKAEGIIDIHEFFDSAGNVRIAVGDTIEVLVLGRDEETGLLQVSHRKARGQLAWDRIQQAHRDGEPVSGRVVRTVKSGLLVDIGMECFMPASQIDVRRVENLEEWVGREIEAVVLDVDTRKRRAVISRRKLIEAAQQEALVKALEKIAEGTVVQGKVKSVVNFGAFVEMEGIDAFLPREELSWDRAVAPSSLLKEGAPIKVQVLTIDHDTGRVRVSRKALRKDPWDTVAEKYPKGSQVKGEVVSVTRYGAFVHIEEGLTGLIHVSEMSWGKQPTRVTDHVKEGDSVRAVVLDIDTHKRRMALGLRQLVEDPWLEAEKKFPKGSKVKGAVSGLTDFGAFVKLNDEIEGLIHISDISWTEHIKHPKEKFEVGQEVEALVLKTDRNTKRISLGIKQMTESPFDQFVREHPAGSTMVGKVVRMIDVGAFLELAPGEGGNKIDGFMHISEISDERTEKPQDALEEGQDLEVKILKIDKRQRRISLSRKALIKAQERAAIKQYKADPADKGVMKLGELLQGLDIKTTDDES